MVNFRIFQPFPGLTGGELSKIKAFLVSAASLVRLAERVRLGEFLRLSRGEDKTGGRRKRAILVDTYEAIIGAVYLDGGVGAASAFVDHEVGDFLENINIGEFIYGDFKSALQE